MDVASGLAPFIAWLASREPDELFRRRCRAHVQTYLEFAVRHGGPSAALRRRWEAVGPPSGIVATDRRRALDLFEEYRTILRRTEIPTRVHAR